MKTIFPIFLIISLMISVSCSSLKQQPQKTVQHTPEEWEKINRETLARASDQLAQQVDQAKGNPAHVNFLASDIFLKGNMALLDGDFALASVLFKHLVDLVPEDDFVQKKYAVSLIRSGDLEGARLVLTHLYEKKQEEKVGLILAGVFSGLDQEEEARNVYRRVLAVSPANEDACVFLSKSYAVEKNTSAAIALLKSCTKKDPKNGMFDYYIGKIHVDNGDLDRAEIAFKESRRRQPTLSAATNALGIIYEERENFKAAIEVYKSFLAERPEDATVLARIIQAMFLASTEDGKLAAEVLPYVEKLSDLEPDNHNLKVKLGILYTDGKRFSEAVSVFKDLLSLAPDSDKLLYYLGAIYQEMKQYPDSIEYFNQVPPSSTLYSDSSIQMATMLSSLAQEEYFTDKSAAVWREKFLNHVNGKLAELKEFRVEFSVIKSGFYEGISQYREAMETMMVVQHEEGFSTQHKYYLANLFERENKFEESTELIMGIIEKDPKNAHAWNFLGYSLLERGEEMEKAYHYIKTALDINPDDGYIRDSLGWYFYKQGQTKRALSELEQALAKVPDDVEILKHLAIVHRDLREFSKAKSYYETALKHAKLHVDRQELMNAIEKLEGDRVPAASAQRD